MFNRQPLQKSDCCQSLYRQQVLCTSWRPPPQLPRLAAKNLAKFITRAEEITSEIGNKPRIARARYNARRRRGRQQQELQDLLIDPAYDPLFDGVGGAQDDLIARKDPFRQTSAVSKRKEFEGQSSQYSLSDSSREDNLQRRGRTREEVDEDDELVAALNQKPPHQPTAFQLSDLYQRWIQLQNEQAEVMRLHHKHRNSEVPPFATANALAGLMEKLEREDEKMGTDRHHHRNKLPSWIRAKKLIYENWEMMEELGGRRKDVMESLTEIADAVEERQHLLDTWDPSIYEGEKDSEEPVPDYMDQFLLFPEDGSDTQQYSPTEKVEPSLMDELLPDELSHSQEVSEDGTDIEQSVSETRESSLMEELLPDDFIDKWN